MSAGDCLITKSTIVLSTEFTNSNACGFVLNNVSSRLISISSNASEPPYCPTRTAHSSLKSMLSCSTALNTSNNLFNAFDDPFSEIIP